MKVESKYLHKLANQLISYWCIVWLSSSKFHFIVKSYFIPQKCHRWMSFNETWNYVKFLLAIMAFLQIDRFFCPSQIPFVLAQYFNVNVKPALSATLAVSWICLLQFLIPFTRAHGFSLVVHHSKKGIVLFKHNLPAMTYDNVHD